MSFALIVIHVLNESHAITADHHSIELHIPTLCTDVLLRSMNFKKQILMPIFIYANNLG